MQQLVKRVMFLWMCILLILSSFPPESVQAAKMSSGVQAWANVRIDSAPPATLTAQTINDYLKTNGKSEKARTGDVGGAIMEAAKANGINPALMFSMFWHETGGGANWKFTRINNPGGIRCKTGYPCEKEAASCEHCALWTKFDSVKQGFQVKAEILRGYMENRGVTTIQQMLEVYAPPSDNNDLYSDIGYIAAIGKNVEKLNVTAGDFQQGNMTPGAEGNYSDGTKVGTWKGQQFFMQSTVHTEMAAVNKGEGIPSFLSYVFASLAMESTEHLTKWGVYLCLALLIYISVVILAYTLVVKEKARADGILGKLIIIKGDVYGGSALGQIAAQATLVICIICLYLTGLYLRLLGVFYGLLENVFTMF